MSEMKRPTEEQMAKFKKNANDTSLSAEVRAKFQAIVDKFENVTEEIGEDVVKEVEPAKKKGRKPRATSTTKTTKTKQSASDVEKAKAEIKKRTGKTEEECESIIEEYRALRTKAQEGKRKAEQASADNKKRVEKLEDKGDLIEGTNVKTADAVIETTAKDVAEKIEQQIEAVEEKAEKEAKVEVAKDKTIKTPKAKKEAVEKKVDEKVKKETKVVVQRVVIDTSALLTSIATTLGKFDKDSQKEFLIKLRSDIDKLLSKYAFGGLTNGATQTMNITQSNLSASSVNPTMFAEGGEVAEYKVGDNVRYLFNNRVETGEIVRRIDDESVEVRSGFSSALVNDRRIVGLAPKKRFSFFEHGGGVDGNDKEIALEFFTGDGLGLRYVIDGKFQSWMFKNEMNKRLNSACGNQGYLKGLIREWSSDLGMNQEDYYETMYDDEETINVYGFIEDSTKRAKHLFSILPSKYAQGGMTEHGLRVGDEILSSGVNYGFPNEIEVNDSNKKRHIVNLDKGTRGMGFAKGGNVSSMLRNRRGM